MVDLYLEEAQKKCSRDTADLDDRGMEPTGADETVGGLGTVAARGISVVFSGQRNGLLSKYRDPD